MPTRRAFLAAAAASAAASAVTPLTSAAQQTPESNPPRAASGAGSTTAHYRIPHRLGLGGVAVGTGFAPLTGEQSDQVMQAAWADGVRYFDTSPWYGLGVSERRMAHVLTDKERDAYIISTKIGRLLTPSRNGAAKTMWKAPAPFYYRYDYTADGTRRSIEDSLQRMGLARIDVVFIHDLAPDHFGEKWTEQFDMRPKGRCRR